MRVDPSDKFSRDLSRLGKKYRSIFDDVAVLKKQLELDPYQGNSLGKNSFKIRMAITSKGKGKSGGARVITCVKVLADRIVLLTIYDKSEREDLRPGELDELLAGAGL